jgi:hypothetical protein
VIAGEVGAADEAGPGASVGQSTRACVERGNESPALTFQQQCANRSQSMSWAAEFNAMRPVMTPPQCDIGSLNARSLQMLCWQHERGGYRPDVPKGIGRGTRLRTGAGWVNGRASTCRPRTWPIHRCVVPRLRPGDGWMLRPSRSSSDFLARNDQGAFSHDQADNGDELGSNSCPSVQRSRGG